MAVLKHTYMFFMFACLITYLRADEFLYDTFPDNFIWSSATSAYQIEGGWDADGKGPNIWDTYTSVPDNIEDGSNGNVACDSYNKFEEDVKLLRSMGVKMYRFSLSWSRILPDGTLNTINEAGIDYYNSLISELLENDITPMVTMYHWDLPQALENQGGWLNDSIIDHFKEYAKVVYERLNNVQYWLTFNEPFVFCWLGYGVAVHAPGKFDMGEGGYTCAHNVIRSHAEAYHAYQGDGKVSITLDSDWKEPFDPNNETDVTAAERAMQFKVNMVQCGPPSASVEPSSEPAGFTFKLDGICHIVLKLGWYAHPIFVNGDYPDIMKERVAAKSTAQGFNKSRLPEFTEAEKTMIEGTHDFFGLNHYTTQLIRENIKTGDPSYEDDQDTDEIRDSSWPTTGSDWLRVVPWGLRKLLNFIKNNYGDDEIFITENGCSDRNTTDGDVNLRDQHRTNYYRNYINEVLKAIKLDNCNVRGYAAWSLMDNFEWASGYTENFGLHYVDFNNPDRPRVPKDSAKAYQEIIMNNGFVSAASHVSFAWWAAFVALFLAAFMI